MSENRDPDVVRRDRKSEEFFEPLAEVIAEELLARISVRARLEMVEDVQGVADLIADAVLDRFAVGSLPAERGDRQVARAVPADSAVVLDVRDLSVAYGAKNAVDGVSLRIAQGEIFGLLSPNGAGKTSTLSAIEGLIKPRSGAVFVDGVDIRSQPSQAKAKLGVQLQATSFQPQLTITQIMRLYAGLYGVALPVTRSLRTLRGSGLKVRRPSPSSSCPAGSSNASRCTSRSSTDRHCCCSTNRQPVSIRSRVVSFGSGSRTSDNRVEASC